MINIDHYLGQKRLDINRALKEYLAFSGTGTVIRAMRYSLEAGGKRLRPVLVLATAEAIQGESSDLLPLACAYEMVHTYSLIHDDLPAMDDSDLRRGKVTCHLEHGEATAILAGDALLTLAYEITADYGLKHNCPDKALLIIKNLSVSAGAAGMIGGQALDLQGEKEVLSLEDTEKMAALKTGALIRSAVYCGAVAAGADKQELEALDRYALAIGTAFQVVDDILDYESSSDRLGKPAGADQEKSKTTFPAVMGLKQAKKRAELLYEEAIEALQDLGKPTGLLEALARKLVYRIN